MVAVNLPNTPLRMGPRRFRPRQSGTNTFGPITVADTDTQALLVIDRTVIGAFNSLPPVVRAVFVFEISLNNGVNWITIGQVQFAAGVLSNADGQLNQDQFMVSYGGFAGSARQLRARVIVTGSQVSLSGSLTSS